MRLYTIEDRRLVEFEGDASQLTVTDYQDREVPCVYIHATADAAWNAAIEQVRIKRGRLAAHNVKVAEMYDAIEAEMVANRDERNKGKGE